MIKTGLEMFGRIIKTVLWILLYTQLCCDKVASSSDYQVGHPTGVAVQPMNLVAAPKIPVSGISEKGDKVTDILHSILSKYDNRIRPFFPDGPVVVKVTIPFIQIADVVESKQEISSILVLQQSWVDPRLEYFIYEHSDDIPFITINHEHTREIWLADTHFVNEKKAQVHDVTMANDVVLLYRNGTIVRSMRITLTTDCAFSYENFPFDSQKCEIVIGSNAFKSNDVKYIWDDTFMLSFSGKNMISHTGKFVVEPYSIYETTETEGLSQLFVYVELQRAWRPFITRFYFPMVLFVFVSLGTLFLEAPKIGMLVNLFNLAFVNIFIAIRSSSVDIPRTSIGTAFDTYFVICLCYIGIVILTTLHKLSRLKSERSTERNRRSNRGEQSSSNFDSRNGTENDIFNPNHEDEEATHDSRSETDIRQIYRSPSYALNFTSSTKICWRKTLKILESLYRRLRWIMVACFLFTDYIYFKIHSVQYT